MSKTGVGSAHGVLGQGSNPRSPAYMELSSLKSGAKSSNPNALSETNGPSDPNLVVFSTDDPDDPKNWPLWRKNSVVVIASLFTFIAPASSSMIAPALPEISKQFNMENVPTQLALSIFVFTYGAGAVLFGPLGEIYGRVLVIQAGNLSYLVFNTACALSRSQTQLLVFRCLSGFGGSAALALGAGILSDCYRPEERGTANALYNLAPLLGPSLGPLAGGKLIFMPCIMDVSDSHAMQVSSSSAFLGAGFSTFPPSSILSYRY